ncbi:prophage antirepressor [Desulfobulbus propionicus DSM 2032]|uniref:Prophage antirepressor n=1 Tax=Desulfobulbus propionicus (strain ATCC 33891 / DSM 2032 / VKM B-1956 / 1pr3) TaxID=577650 RepID=A0A7U4DMW7_DESPD|nr:Bro-N domain-containing protein [Desulfobulbus propionicus]ADW16391.1 prophage antirepressor [Desulfobulbus propionicus DSM 2032]
MPEITPFCFNDSMVRTLTIDNAPWFVAKDVAELLGYANTKDAISRHCKGVVKHYPLRTAGGIQEIRIINEPNLYRLVAHSKLPAAEKFEAWIYEEVLPSIRKTGSYSQDDGGRKTDIFYHRGPVSPGGLDIRYQLDLTKVVLRPTSTSLRVLQRVTGIDLADMIAELEHPASSLADTLVRDFCQQCLAAAPGERVRLSRAVEAINRWLADLVGHGEKKQPRQLGAELRNLGYTLRKIGGVYWIMDVSMDVNR